MKWGLVRKVLRDFRMTQRRVILSERGAHSSISWSWHLISVKSTSLFIRQRGEKTDQSKNSDE